MGYKRLLVEIGMGVDLMGKDVYVSVERAINDIVHRVCIPYFREKNIDFKKVKIILNIYTPYPEKIDPDRIPRLLPVKPGEVEVYIHRGGASIRGLEEIIVSIVSIEILVPE